MQYQINQNTDVQLTHTLVHEALQQALLQGLQGLRGHRIEQVANLVVAGDLMHAEQGLRTVVSMGLVHAPLKLQKRGALHEKDRLLGGSFAKQFTCPCTTLQIIDYSNWISLHCRDLLAAVRWPLKSTMPAKSLWKVRGKLREYCPHHRSLARSPVREKAGLA